MKHSKPSMGICLKCRQVRVLASGLCRDCRTATPPPTRTRAPQPPAS